MAIDKEIKKKISEEWLVVFPQLLAFTPNKLYKILGCTVIGIELIKLPHSEEYRPHFVIYSLWKENTKACFNAPIVMLELQDKKGLQFRIPFMKHSNFFNEAILGFTKQIPISVNDDVTLKSLLELIDTRHKHILVKSNSAEQAKLWDFKFHIALYIGNQALIENVLYQIQKESPKWDMYMFELWYGKFELWLHSLQEKVNRRVNFLEQVSKNRQDKKVLQLKYSEIIA